MKPHAVSKWRGEPRKAGQSNDGWKLTTTTCVLIYSRNYGINQAKQRPFSLDHFNVSSSSTTSFVQFDWLNKTSRCQSCRSLTDDRFDHTYHAKQRQQRQQKTTSNDRQNIFEKSKKGNQITGQWNNQNVGVGIHEIISVTRSQKNVTEWPDSSSQVTLTCFSLWNFYWNLRLVNVALAGQKMMKSRARHCLAFWNG